MNPYDDLLKRQRNTAPPPGASEQVEQLVMARIARLPDERRRRRIVLTAVSMLCSLTLVVLFATRQKPEHAGPPDFIESIVILDDHICIWLDTPTQGTASGTTHE